MVQRVQRQPLTMSPPLGQPALDQERMVKERDTQQRKPKGSEVKQQWLEKQPKVPKEKETVHVVRDTGDIIVIYIYIYMIFAAVHSRIIS